MKERLSKYWPLFAAGFTRALPWMGRLLMPILAGGITFTAGGYYIEFRVQKVISDAHASAQAQLEQTKGEIISATEALTDAKAELQVQAAELTQMAGAVRMPALNRKPR